jgi:hypothetical protein
MASGNEHTCNLLNSDSSVSCHLKLGHAALGNETTRNPLDRQTCGQDRIESGALDNSPNVSLNG